MSTLCWPVSESWEHPFSVCWSWKKRWTQSCTAQFPTSSIMFSLLHTHIFIQAHLSSSVIQRTWIFSPVYTMTEYSVLDHAAWFGLLLSSSMWEFENLAQMCIWLETLLIWTDSKKYLSSSDLPPRINNYSVGRWSFPAVVLQSHWKVLQRPPQITHNSLTGTKIPANEVEWAIKVSTWTPPTCSTLRTVHGPPESSMHSLSYNTLLLSTVHIPQTENKVRFSSNPCKG